MDDRPLFTLTRAVAAPRARVFRSWTEPEHLAWFFNPEQPLPDAPATVDLRVGGQWRQRMVVNEATAYTTGGVYREIVPNARLAFTWGAVGGWPDLDPRGPDPHLLVVLDFEDDGDGTRMTLTQHVPATMTDVEAAEWLAKGIRKGWSTTIDRLVAASA